MASALADGFPPSSAGVRDYIHVVDLAKGHIAALKKLKENCGCKVGKCIDLVRSTASIHVVFCWSPRQLSLCYLDFGSILACRLQPLLLICSGDGLSLGRGVFKIFVPIKFHHPILLRILPVSQNAFSMKTLAWPLSYFPQPTETKL